MSARLRLLFALVLPILPAWPIAAAEEAPPAAGWGHTVVMNPFLVKDHSIFFGCSMYLRFGGPLGAIDQAKFTEIQPGSLAEKAGLEVGDRLLAINGASVIGCSPRQFFGLMRQSAGPGVPAHYAFAVERGFFTHQRLTLSLAIESQETIWIGARREDASPSDQTPAALVPAQPRP
jgi:membrane-associated protease RseP (regulator of RpoE activity)